MFVLYPRYSLVEGVTNFYPRLETKSLKDEIPTFLPSRMRTIKHTIRVSLCWKGFLGFIWHLLFSALLYRQELLIWIVKPYLTSSEKDFRIRQSYIKHSNGFIRIFNWWVPKFLGNKRETENYWTNGIIFKYWLVHASLSFIRIDGFYWTYTTHTIGSPAFYG